MSYINYKALDFSDLNRTFLPERLSKLLTEYEKIEFYIEQVEYENYAIVEIGKDGLSARISNVVNNIFNERKTIENSIEKTIKTIKEDIIRFLLNTKTDTLIYAVDQHEVRTTFISFFKNILNATKEDLLKINNGGFLLRLSRNNNKEVHFVHCSSDIFWVLCTFKELNSIGSVALQIGSAQDFFVHLTAEIYGLKLDMKPFEIQNVMQEFTKLKLNKKDDELYFKELADFLQRYLSYTDKTSKDNTVIKIKLSDLMSLNYIVDRDCTIDVDIDFSDILGEKYEQMNFFYSNKYSKLYIYVPQPALTKTLLENSIAKAETEIEKMLGVSCFITIPTNQTIIA